jgi:alpha-tubulin suppressor-like RCC1 family protein
MKSTGFVKLTCFILFITLGLILIIPPLPVAAEGVRPPMSEQAATLKVETISAGGQHTCTLRSNGTVICWGDNSSGQINPPAGTFTQISAGYLHTCGVRTDGTVACWGLGKSIGSNLDYGQSIPPDGTFTQVSAGSYHTCGLRSDGTVACWGGDWFGQSTPPAGTFLQVNAGDDYSCGLRSDGTIACWGGYSFRDPPPTPPTGIFIQVLAGCGLRINRTVDCWYGGVASKGPFTQISNGCGLKNDGTIDCWYGPAAPAGTFTQVSVGYYHACGLRSNGTVVCWGDNFSGQIKSATGRFGRQQVIAGGGHSCGLKSDGTIVCWGKNDSGQANPPSGTFSQISAGNAHTCGLKSDGMIICWGADGFGQSQPPAGTFIQISAGDGHHSCGIKSNGTLACWGKNDYGQATPPAGSFILVSAGGFHTCGLKSNGTLACWGRNTSGQASPPAGTFSQVSAGGSFTCGLKSDGSITCWGSNTLGQSAPPTGTFSQISAGGGHACGLRSDGTLACWGSNSDGQSAPPSGTFIQVSAGDAHTCAVRNDGVLDCWGSNRDARSLTHPQIMEGLAVTVAMHKNSNPLPFSLILHASGADSSTFKWSITRPASHGTAIANGTGESKLVSYTPKLDYTGSDSFTVQVVDDNNLASEIMVTVNILPVDVVVNIAGAPRGAYVFPPSGVIQPFYAYTQNGPVKISSPDHVPFMASLWPDNDVFETIGYTAAQLTTEYWFPWYDNVSMNTWIVVDNTTPSRASVEIRIGASNYTYSIPANGHITLRYPDKVDGPVWVHSTNGVRILASERSVSDSFNELLGYPGNQLTNEYWLPWYDNVSMAAWVVVGNTSATDTAEVEISIGKMKYQYSIPPGSSITPRFSGKMDGPVHVLSMNGVNILASERVLYGNAFSELMAYPASQLTTEYWFPRYSPLQWDTWILVGNSSNRRAANVDIFVGSVKHSYTIPPGKVITPLFRNLEGSARVVSTNGVKIFTSERAVYGNIFDEVMGYPAGMQASEYWFPWYDTKDMTTFIFLGRP